MKSKMLPITLSAALIICVAVANAQTDDKEAGRTLRTQFIPDTVWPDNNGVHINAHGGGILDYDGIYYWFGEHKIAGSRGNTAQVGVHCYSSRDLYNWTDQGIALSVVDDPDSEIVRGCVIERPKVVHNKKTGKFVMWFHLELKGQDYTAARTAVAVSDTVTGPYTYLRSFRPNAGNWPTNAGERDKRPGERNYLERDFATGQMARDMTVFVDDDGTAYHIHSSEENGTLHIAELSDDYLSFTGKYTRQLPFEHNEAPAVFKHNGLYYMITSGCTGWAPNPARSAVAENIFGPWKPLGNPTVGINLHSGMGPEKTFGGQSTHVLSVRGKPGAFIAMFDVWTPRNPIDGRYIWLPVEFEGDRIIVRWKDAWSLDIFDDEKE